MKISFHLRAEDDEFNFLSFYFGWTLVFGLLLAILFILFFDSGRGFHADTFNEKISLSILIAFMAGFISIFNVALKIRHERITRILDMRHEEMQTQLAILNEMRTLVEALADSKDIDEMSEKRRRLVHIAHSEFREQLLYTSKDVFKGIFQTQELKSIFDAIQRVEDNLDEVFFDGFKVWRVDEKFKAAVNDWIADLSATGYQKTRIQIVLAKRKYLLLLRKKYLFQKVYASF